MASRSKEQNRVRHFAPFLAALFAAVLSIDSAIAGVYRCPAENGSNVYTDKPCSDGDRSEDGSWVNLQEERQRLREQQRIDAERQAEREREAHRLAIEQQEKERREREEQARARAKAHSQTKRRAALPAPKTETLSLPFNECLARKAQVIASLGVNPRDIIPIVNTGIMTMDRICTVDGSVLITCSKPDRKMAITQSSAHYDVGCK